jgi:uncharacterized protein (TIGR03118 family)
MHRCFNEFRVIFEFLEPRKLLSANSYIQQDLVSDGSVTAAHLDTHLVNPWGLVTYGKGIQVADADSGFSTGYDASGNSTSPAVHVPGPASTQGSPTGVVYNTNPSKFLVTVHSVQEPATFIYSTENGTIDAWSTLNKNRTVVVAADHSAQHSVYKGLALATLQGVPYLYAADFTLGRIDVFDSNFQPFHLPGSFTDPHLPAHYSPFNVQLINGQLLVTYAKRARGADDPTVGATTGVIDVFNTAGQFVRRFAAGGTLNAPWGMALAPANFAAFSNDILVGNFGDGKISAFDPATGAFKGQLSDSSGHAISIDGLWGLAFGNGRAGTLKNGLYFTAGVEHEAGGLYGRLLVDPYAISGVTPQPMGMAFSTSRNLISLMDDLM